MIERALKGRVALVTGASRGIGRAIAIRLAAEGAHVIATALDDKWLSAFAADVAKDDLGIEVAALDVADPMAIERVIETHHPDLLVHNAGIAEVRHFLEEDDATWDHVMNVNLKGAFLLGRAFARALVLAARPGAIVHVGSVGGTRGHRSMASYDASKAGVEGLTRAMALDLAPLRIRVNAIAPGAIDVGLDPRERRDGSTGRGATVPFGRVGRPDDVARAAVFLLSDDAAYITGAVLPVDGGLGAQLLPPSLDVPFPDALARTLEGRLR